MTTTMQSLVGRYLLVASLAFAPLLAGAAYELSCACGASCPCGAACDCP